MFYKYCPFCASAYDLKNDSVTKDYPNLYKCSDCGKVVYNNPKPAVAGLLVKGGKILLTKRKNDPFKGDWDLPGGFMDYGESPIETIVREMKEELNLDVTVLGIKYAFNLYYPVTNEDNLSLTILVCGIECENMDGIRADDDVEGYAFFDKETCPENIASLEQAAFIKKVLSDI